MKYCSIKCFSVATLAATISTASGAIIGTSGDVTVVASPPSNVSSNAWESNTIIRAFAEQQDVALPQSIAIDISQPGTSPTGSTQNLSSSTIASGVHVSSYMLHFDVDGTRATGDALEASGSITFDQPVLGLIALPDTLNTSNAILGLANLTYSSGSDHGLELTPGGAGTSDVVTLSSDRRTVSVDLLDAAFSDDLRVVTAVPEPAALAALFVPALMLTRRRTSR